MPKFRVEFSGPLEPEWSSCTIEVEAETEEEAVDMARDLADNYKADWSMGLPYDYFECDYVEQID